MSELVLLQGSPGARGEELGRAQSGMLKEITEEFKQRCAKHGQKESELPDRARQLTALINSLVPEWITEARAAAAAAGMPVATYLAMSSTPDVMHEALAGPMGEGGTAFFAVGQACQGAKAYLHLSRDSRRTPQFAFSRAASPGTLAYVALAGGADLGLHAFVNESGLAGCWQYGPPVRDYGNGLRPPLLLRAMAERCVTCQQAVAHFADLQTRYGLDTPGNRGLIFMLADASGEAVVIEARSIKFSVGAQREGLGVAANEFQLPDSPGGPQSRDVARQRKLREYLGEAPVDLMRALASSRFTGTPDERGVCNAFSAACFTAAIGAPGGQPWAAVSIGSPRCAQPLVLMPGIGVPAPAMDGSAWISAEALRQRNGPEGVRNERRVVLDEKLAKLLAPLGTRPLDQAERDDLVLKSYHLLLEFMDEASAPA